MALLDRISGVTPTTFTEVALKVFHYQASHNPIYARYLDLLRTDPATVTAATEIPHLPIALFKTYKLKTGDWRPVRTFTSSGTTGAATSRHPLRNEAWYRQGARRTFERVYGPLRGRPILALLPGYLERTGSSLVFMADDFIRRSGHPASGFYLDDLPGLTKELTRLNGTPGPRPVLIGVSFALLDLAEQHPQAIPDVIIMETGGMKGRRRELTRAELHGTLTKAFGVKNIHSEYGMTELLSQAYSTGRGRFQPAPTLRVTAREVTDPLATVAPATTGILNLMDLANLDTVSFIASDDLGRVYDDGTFEVLGRLDASDVRGCNLLVG